MHVLKQNTSSSGPSLMRSSQTYSKRIIHKTHQLSVVFCEFISSVLNSGEVDEKLMEIGVEIVKVCLFILDQKVP